jgi:2-polyprenyl-6-hydroxyphenyl methylase/3-demethylubiquinone-9 3-methyltransferase
MTKYSPMNARRADNSHAAELAKFGELAAEWWDPHGPFKTLHDINPLRLEYVARRAELQGARVLDVGCGGGLLAEAMAARGAEVTGLDLEPRNLEAARAHAVASGVEIEYLCRDVEGFAMERAGHYDVITCMELLEHVPDPRSIVAACARAVRAGGCLIFSTINRSPKSFLFAIVGAEYVLRMVPRGTHEYLKLIRPAELAAWCREARLDVLEVTGLHLNPLTWSYSLGGNADVNYLLSAGSPGNRV